MTSKLEELEARLAALGPEAAESTERVDLLLEIAAAHIGGDDPQRLIEITHEALELSQRLGYDRGKAYGLLFEGLSCCFIADHRRGLARVDESFQRLEELGDESGIAWAKLLRGNILRSIGSFDKAMPLLFEAEAYFRKSGQRFTEADTHYSLGLLYHEIKDYKQAYERHRKTIEVMEGQDEQWLVARALNGVGRALDKLGKEEDALDYHHRSLALFRKIGHPMGEARALDDIGSIYMKLGDYEMALPFHTKSLDIRDRIGQRRAQCTSLLNIARVHVRQENHEAALETLAKAVKIAEETESKSHVYDAHKLYSEAYELRGDHERALAHYKKYETAKEEVFNETTTERIHKLQVGFEVEQAEQQAEIERLKNVELREKNERLEALLDELRATQAQLIQSEKQAVLGKLAAGMMHELNTPLGACNSALDVSRRCIDRIADLNGDGTNGANTDSETSKLLTRLRENYEVTRAANDRISRILTNLRSFVRLDGGEREPVDINAGLDATVSLLEGEIADRIKVVRDYGDLPKVECCPGEVNQVLMSLITNAIESIDGPGTVTLRTRASDGEVRIAVSDTGVGIPLEAQSRLFDPAFSTKGTRVKAGMGLMVSLNVVQKHGGRIDVESEPGKGSTFTIVMPIAT